MRILIGMPTVGRIYPEVFKAIYEMNDFGHKIDFDFTKGYGCDMARNELAKKCISGGYDKIFMIDSDIVIPSDALENLLYPQAPIVLGCYKHKYNGSDDYILYRIGQHDHKDRIGASYFEDDYRKPVKSGGLGCALIDRSVFERIEYPWFDYILYKNGNVLSEDLDFCDKASRSGYVIFADARVVCGHIGEFVK